MDTVTPVFALLMIGLGLSSLAAETAYGELTDLPWGIPMRGGTRHPTQLYETTAALLIFALIWFRTKPSRPGLLFLQFAALTAAARLFLEAFRGDSHYQPGGFREAQLLSWVVLGLSFLLIDRILKPSIKKEKAPR
jgi:prolipoprotein diacylglyceryltransferase